MSRGAPTLLLAALLLAAGGCFTGKAPPAAGDGAAAPDLGAADQRAADGLEPDTLPGANAPDGGAAGEAGCQLGLPDSCNTCDDVCPGVDDPTGNRTCQAGACGYACTGERYDVDGDPATGCEAVDDLPLHSSEAAAKDLGSVDACGVSEKLAIGRLPSDDRQHLAPPAARPQGRPDYFRVLALDASTCALNPKISLDATALPASITLRLQVTYRCLKGDKSVLSKSLQVSGGKSAALVWSGLNCTGTLNDSGTMILRVERDAASTGHSAASYALRYVL